MAQSILRKCPVFPDVVFSIASRVFLLFVFFLQGIGVLLLLLRPRDPGQDPRADRRRSSGRVPPQEGSPLVGHVSLMYQ